MASPKNSDPRPTFHHLKTTNGRPKQCSVDQDRPAFPSPVRFPALSNAHVNAAAAYVDPVVWISRVLVDSTPVGRSGGHNKEALGGEDLDIPHDRAQLNSAIVTKERAVIRVVVQPLFDNVGGPAESKDVRMLAESFKPTRRFTARLGKI